MCGILGVLPASFSTDYFTSVLSRLAHRGPDGGHIWVDPEKAMLGHRRLSILDLSDKGTQPMHWQERYVITFNGEIYNYQEIKKRLGSEGYLFQTGSDTEVLIAAYAHWGANCLSYLNGMWAFAIWDKVEQTLFLARDRFGVKPLFYSLEKGQLVFASEMKAIIPFLSEKNPSGAWSWCYQHQHDYEGTEHTLVKGVQRLPAGHYGLYYFASSTLSVVKYWDTLEQVQENTKPYTTQVEEFKALFLDACKLRLRADVPIATALSGGIDSSVVSAALTTLRSGPSSEKDFQVFTASFPGSEELNETQDALRVANHLQVPISLLEVDTNFPFEKVAESIWRFEELYETTPLPMMALYQQIANRGYKISIDGHGGDELFAGYGHAIFQIVKDKPWDLPLIKQLIEMYKAMYLPGSTKSWIHLVDAFGGRKNLVTFYLDKFLPKSSSNKPALDHFNAYLYLIFHHTILPTLLRNYDRYSMASGVETRMPFLDYRVVSYAFGLTWASKVRNGFTKAIVRDAFRSDLPSDILNRRRKIGFSSPMNKWFATIWNAPAMDIIHSRAFLENEYVAQPLRLQEDLSRLLKKKELTFGEGSFIWNSLQPYLWKEYFFKRAVNLKE